jgi:hypothetical protein
VVDKREECVNLFDFDEVEAGSVGFVADDCVDLVLWICLVASPTAGCMTMPGNTVMAGRRSNEDDASDMAQVRGEKPPFPF